MLIVANAECCHAACPDCWVAGSEQLVTIAGEARQRDIRRACLEPTCTAKMSDSLWRYILNQSVSVASFVSLMKLETARLKRRMTQDGIIFSPSQFDAGPTCPYCQTRAVGLLVNSCGCHAACEDCWATLVKKEIPRCRTNFTAELSAVCIEPQCNTAASPSILSHLELEWSRGGSAIAEFQKDLRSELARLRHVKGQVLVLGPNPPLAGPVCPVCCEQRLAVFSNPECAHAACEDCWANWALTQLSYCRRQKHVDLLCFGEKCRCPPSWALWQHATTRNEAVFNLEKEFAYRRRLQANELFPVEVQVDCPQAGCLGLGYRGYDTLMCFACEHQWTADEAGESRDTNVETMLGEAMKKCPACREYIIKNGGCDHMTCRCKHEFFWTTLLPYRT